MKRIALQLLLSLVLILQGVSAFGAGFAHAACCCHGGHAVHSHCQHGHGTPCKPNCAQHCIGCATSAFVVMPAFATIAPVVSVVVPSIVRTSIHTCGDLPPTRPPIV